LEEDWLARIAQVSNHNYPSFVLCAPLTRGLRPQILSDQQVGLVHLEKILKGDLADINVVLKGGGRQGEGGDGEELRAVEAIGVRIVGADSSIEVSRRNIGRSDNFIRCRQIHP
jgi:hypothetical protein